MASNCRDYEQVGYCLRGRECTQRHGVDLIELDVSGYEGLIGAKKAALSAAAAQIKEQQIVLARKQTDLLSNLVSQQRNLIQRIESCSDGTEKARLKSILSEMSQKTKDWIEQGGGQSKSATLSQGRDFEQTKGSSQPESTTSTLQQASSSKHP